MIKWLFETISADELRKDLALWLCRNKRSAPYLSGPAAADFVEDFTIPDTDFEMTQQYVDQNGEILVLFNRFASVFMADKKRKTLSRLYLLPG